MDDYNTLQFKSSIYPLNHFPLLSRFIAYLSFGHEARFKMSSRVLTSRLVLLLEGIGLFIIIEGFPGIPKSNKRTPSTVCEGCLPSCLNLIIVAIPAIRIFSRLLFAAVKTILSFLKFFLPVWKNAPQLRNYYTLDSLTLNWDEHFHRICPGTQHPKKFEI